MISTVSSSAKLRGSRGFEGEEGSRRPGCQGSVPIEWLRPELTPTRKPGRKREGETYTWARVSTSWLPSCDRNERSSSKPSQTLRTRSTGASAISSSPIELGGPVACCLFQKQRLRTDPKDLRTDLRSLGTQRPWNGSEKLGWTCPGSVDSLGVGSFPLLFGGAGGGEAFQVIRGAFWTAPCTLYL